MDTMVRLFTESVFSIHPCYNLALYRKGLRVTVLLGAIGSATAAWINVIGVAPDRFYVIDRQI